MISKTDIAALAEHVLRRQRSLPDRAIMHPVREWFIGLVAALCIVVLAGGLSAYHFAYYSDIKERVTGAEPSDIEYEKGRIENVLYTYRERKEAYEAFKTALPPVLTATSTIDEHSIELERSEVVPLQVE